MFNVYQGIVIYNFLSSSEDRMLSLSFCRDFSFETVDVRIEVNRKILMAWSDCKVWTMQALMLEV